MKKITILLFVVFCVSSLSACNLFKQLKSDINKSKTKIVIDNSKIKKYIIENNNSNINILANKIDDVGTIEDVYTDCLNKNKDKVRAMNNKKYLSEEEEELDSLNLEDVIGSNETYREVINCKNAVLSSSNEYLNVWSEEIATKRYIDSGFDNDRYSVSNHTFFGEYDVKSRTRINYDETKDEAYLELFETIELSGLNEPLQVPEDPIIYDYKMVFIDKDENDKTYYQYTNLTYMLNFYDYRDNDGQITDIEKITLENNGLKSFKMIEYKEDSYYSFLSYLNKNNNHEYTVKKADLENGVLYFTELVDKYDMRTDGIIFVENDTVNVGRYSDNWNTLSTRENSNSYTNKFYINIVPKGSESKFKNLELDNNYTWMVIRYIEQEYFSGISYADRSRIEFENGLTIEDTEPFVSDMFLYDGERLCFKPIKSKDELKEIMDKYEITCEYDLDHYIDYASDIKNVPGFTQEMFASISTEELLNIFNISLINVGDLLNEFNDSLMLKIPLNSKTEIDYIANLIVDETSDSNKITIDFVITSIKNSDREINLSSFKKLYLYINNKLVSEKTPEIVDGVLLVNFENDLEEPFKEDTKIEVRLNALSLSIPLEFQQETTENE